MLERWDDHKHDGRIHPIFDLLTKTGRTSSNSPSAQNFPRDPAFRAIIKASPGKVIISADYSQAELRIAAAMAERELARAAKELNDKQQLELDPRIRRALEDARNRHERHDPPPPLIPWKYGDSHWFKAKLSELGYAYYQTLAHGRMMAAVLREKLDPHLLTAIAMTARSGQISLGGMPELEFLRQSDQRP
jgi:DNA polymerase family A